jgi:hypothetical protein
MQSSHTAADQLQLQSYHRCSSTAAPISSPLLLKCSSNPITAAAEQQLHCCCSTAAPIPSLLLPNYSSAAVAQLQLQSNHWCCPTTAPLLLLN